MSNILIKDGNENDKYLKAAGVGSDADPFVQSKAIEDVNGYKAIVDAVSSALVNIPYEHHELHEGDAYKLCDLLNLNSTTQKWMITTPDTTKYAHMIISAVCTGEIALTVTEGADRTGTTPLTPINRNRNSANVSGLTIHRGVSGGTTDGATAILSGRAGATGVGAKSGSTGEARGENEFILKPNTKYVIQAETFANVYATLKLDWYEHTDAN